MDTHKDNCFSLCNDSSQSVHLYIEPEGAFYPLQSGEEVMVSDDFVQHPVTLKISSSANGETEIVFWPGDGKLRIEKAGMDILDMK